MTTTRKITTLAVSAVLALALLIGIAAAFGLNTSAAGATATLENGVLTISGTGEYTDDTYAGEYFTEIIIEKGVTSIGDYALSECSADTLTIGVDVTNIGEGNFYFALYGFKTINLKCATLPTIGDYAFYYALNGEETVNVFCNWTGGDTVELEGMTYTVNKIGHNPDVTGCSCDVSACTHENTRTVYNGNGQHYYECTNCTNYQSEPETCTVGTAATCNKGAICKVCLTEYTEPDATKHKYSAATCTTPATCSVCKGTDGEALGHNFADATCTRPKTCKRCWATEGVALGHSTGSCGICGMTSDDQWDGTVAESFESGNGTEETPYIIMTAEQLAKLANDLNKDGSTTTYEGVYFKLGADLDLNGGLYDWAPIGGSHNDTTEYNRFKGHFDGNGHTIYNLSSVGGTTNSYRSGYRGLFGGIENATVKNLTIDTAYLGGTYYYFGAAVAYARNSTVENVTVKNVEILVTKNMYCFGGVIGTMENGTIRDCYADNVLLFGTGINFRMLGGGIAGAVYNSTITGCTTNALTNVKDGQVSGATMIGGIVGWAYYAAVEECLVTDSVIQSNGLSSNYDAFGGIVGLLGTKITASDSWIENAFYTDTSTPDPTLLIRPSVVRCGVSGGSITVEKGDVGGIVGMIWGVYVPNATELSDTDPIIKDCYNHGMDITANGTYCNAGGICGYNCYGYIENCYADTAVSAPGSSSMARAVVGNTTNSGNYITNCYYNSETYTGTAGYGTAVTADNVEDGTVTGLLNNSRAGAEAPWAQDGTKGVPMLAFQNPHTHSWSYLASGATITATCTGCSANGGKDYVVTVTLKTPTDLNYSGSAKAITAEQSPAGVLTDLIVKYVGVSTTVYTESTDAPTDVGTYKATLTLENAEASVTYSIAECPHSFENGFCKVCEAYQPADFVDAESSDKDLDGDEEYDAYYAIGNAGQLFWFADKVNSDNANYGTANAVLTADIDLNSGYTFAFVADTGLVEIKKNGSRVAYIGTGRAGDTTGSNTTFDSTASTVGAVYANANDATADEVDLTGFRSWTPIGSSGSSHFSGIFDGDGKTVKGLFFNNTNGSYVGLVGYKETDSSVVKNVGLLDVFINAYMYAGGVAGFNYEGAIENCYVSGFIRADSCAGGVVGENYGTITNCFNTGTVTGILYAGGVVGKNSSEGTVQNCYYLTGCANSEVSVQYGIGANYNFTTADVEGKTTPMSADDFASGQVALLLNENDGVDAPVWGQTLSGNNKDATPVFLTASNTVYSYKDGKCSEYTVKYANVETADNLEHDLTAAEGYTINGDSAICNVCGKQAVAVVTIGGADSYYIGLYQAFDSVNNRNTSETSPATVKLLTSVEGVMGIPVNGYVILNLNGNTITATENTGALGIKDSAVLTVTGEGIIESGSTITILAERGSTLNIQGGTIRSTISTGTAINANGSLNISGGTIEGTASGYAIMYANVEDYVSITITKGTINGVLMDGNPNGSASQPVITGGSFKGLRVIAGDIGLIDLLGDGYYYRENVTNNIITPKDEDPTVANHALTGYVDKGADLAKEATITVENYTFYYTALPREAKITVTVGGKTVDPKYYAVSYIDNTIPGTATVKATANAGSGYTGEISTTFTIEKGRLGISGQSPKISYYYGQKTDEYVITPGKVVLLENTDYEVTGTWTWAEEDMVYFIPDDEFKDLVTYEGKTFAAFTTVNVTTPKLTIKSPMSAIMPGLSMEMTLAVANPHDAELTDLPTSFTIYYQIGDADAVGTEGLKFTLPADAVIGQMVKVWVESAAVENKYTEGKSNELTLDIGMVDYTEIIDALKARIDVLEEGATAHATTAELQALKDLIGELDPEDDTTIIEKINGLTDRIGDLEKYTALLAKLQELGYANSTVKAEDIAKAISDLATLTGKVNWTGRNDTVLDAVKAIEKAIVNLNGILDVTADKNKIETIEESIGNIDSILGDLSDHIGEGKNADLAAVIAEIYSKIDDVTGRVVKLEEFRALVDAISNGEAKGTKAIQNAINALNDLVSDLGVLPTEGTLRQYIDAIKISVNAINEVIGTIEGSATIADQLKTLNAFKETLENANGTIAQLNAKDAALQKEIDDAETTIGEMQESIDDLIGRMAKAEEDIADILADIVNLKSDIAGNKSDITGITGQISNITTKLNALDETFINNAELEQAKKDIAKAYQEAIAAAKSELQTAINTKADTATLNQKVSDLTELINGAKAYADTQDAALKSTLEAAIATAKGDAIKAANEALESAKNDLKTLIENGDAENTSALNTAVANLNTAITLAQTNAQNFATEADKALKAEIDADIAEANALISSIADRLTDAETAIGNINTAIEELKKVDEADAKALENAITKLNAAIDAAKAAATVADGELETKLNTAIDSAKTELGAKIEKVAADLAAAKTALEKAITEGDKALDDKITALTEALEAAKKAYAAADTSLRNSLTSKIEAADTALDAAIKQVQKNLDDATAALEKAIADGDKANADALKQAIDNLNEAINAAESAVTADGVLKSEINAKIDSADALLKAAIDALAGELDSVKQALESKDKELEGKTEELQTFIIIVCVISGVAFCGCATLAVFYIIDKRKNMTAPESEATAEGEPEGEGDDEAQS